MPAFAATAEPRNRRDVATLVEGYRGCIKQTNRDAVAAFWSGMIDSGRRS